MSVRTVMLEWSLNTGLLSASNEAGQHFSYDNTSTNYLCLVFNDHRGSATLTMRHPSIRTKLALLRRHVAVTRSV
jgi:hypothetical protein